MNFKELLGLTNPEDEQITEEPPEVEEPPAPVPQYATVEQMQQMVSGVAAQLQENLVNLMGSQQTRQPEQPQHREPEVREPTLDEIAEAWDEGDSRKALKLQQQREEIREQRYQQQLQQVWSQGQEAFSTINARLLDGQVPDYKRYEKEVQKLMDEVGLDQHTRRNPQVVQLLTDAVKGRNIDTIIAERQEAAARQANEAATAEPSGSRGYPTNVPQPKVISDNGENALRFMGLDKETFAKKRGHTSWEDFEGNAAAYKALKRGEGNYVPKWRRNKQQR